MYYGVYIKSDRNVYDTKPEGTDNLIVLCVEKENAVKIKDILNIDQLIEDRMNKNDN